MLNQKSTDNVFSKLELKGSSKTVTDYFEFAINYILFKRKIYSSEDFKTVQKYDLPLIMIFDEEAKEYIKTVITQLKKWVYSDRIEKLELVIMDKLTFEESERWEFKIETIKAEYNDTNSLTNEKNILFYKNKKSIHKEIKKIFEQISNTVSNLSDLKKSEYGFNIMIYMNTNNKNINVPNGWIETDDSRSKESENELDVHNFDCFSTNFQKVRTCFKIMKDTVVDASNTIDP